MIIFSLSQTKKQCSFSVITLEFYLNGNSKNQISQVSVIEQIHKNMENKYIYILSVICVCFDHC